MLDHSSSALKQSWSAALWRGFWRRCPSCGTGALFSRYVTVNQRCADCDLDLANYRSDDIPAYFTIAIVGHVIVPGILILEQVAHPAAWIHSAIWLPLTLIMTLALLPRVKGAVIGVQWMLRIKG